MHHPGAVRDAVGCRRTVAGRAVGWSCPAPQRKNAQWKITLSAMTSTREMPASLVGDWYQGSRLADGSVRSRLGVSEYTRPASSAVGLGEVAMLTRTLTRMSTTNAAPAATNAAPCPGRVMMPTWSTTHTATAASVPDTSPTQPAVAVIRFQNMP